MYHVPMRNVEVLVPVSSGHHHGNNTKWGMGTTFKPTQLHGPARPALLVDYFILVIIPVFEPSLGPVTSCQATGVHSVHFRRLIKSTAHQRFEIDLEQSTSSPTVQSFRQYNKLSNSGVRTSCERSACGISLPSQLPMDRHRQPCAYEAATLAGCV